MTSEQDIKSVVMSAAAQLVTLSQPESVPDWHGGELVRREDVIRIALWLKDQVFTVPNE